MLPCFGLVPSVPLTSPPLQTSFATFFSASYVRRSQSSSSCSSITVSARNTLLSWAAFRVSVHWVGFCVSQARYRVRTCNGIPNFSRLSFPFLSAEPLDDPLPYPISPLFIIIIIIESSVFCRVMLSFVCPYVPCLLFCPYSFSFLFIFFELFFYHIAISVMKSFPSYLPSPSSVPA